jgi:hypothetical protein
MQSDVDNIKRQLADLDGQRRQILGTRDRSFQDDIIRELARNGCGQQYSQEARRRDSAKNPFAAAVGRGTVRASARRRQPVRQSAVRHLPHAVRAPVRRLLLPGQLLDAAEPLPARLGAVPVAVRAPADLYYHQNPGGAVEQMVSVNSQQPYTSLKSAWRYRKEFVQGCSCKEAEYNAQQAGDRKAEAPATPAAKGSTARLDPR